MTVANTAQTYDFDGNGIEEGARITMVLERIRDRRHRGHLERDALGVHERRRGDIMALTSTNTSYDFDEDGLDENASYTVRWERRVRPGMPGDE
jgi:hypothetical protein